MNRDFSVLVLNEFSAQLQRERETKKLVPSWSTWDSQEDSRKDLPPRKMTILEALSASGLRSIRYAQEVPHVESIIVNDVEESAFKNIERNVQENKLDTKVVIPHLEDAVSLMMKHRHQGVDEAPFDMIDLDPYGAPNPFLYATLQSINDGGLIACTATDLAALCGNNPDACYGRYGAVPMHKPYSHEMALRILLGTLEREACRAGRYIVPLLSLKLDFYVRVFIRVYTSKQEVQKSSTKVGHVFHSRGCDSFYTCPLMVDHGKGNNVKVRNSNMPLPHALCPETDQPYAMGGPIWLKPIHNFEFVSALEKRLTTANKSKMQLAYGPRLGSILSVVQEELPNQPLYYNLPSMAKTLHTSAPKMDEFRSALIHLGYKSSCTHHDPDAVKTDAPPEGMCMFVCV